MNDLFLPISTATMLAQVTPEAQRTLLQFLFHNPWLIIVCLALLIPIVGIIFGTLFDYLRKTRLAELDAGLKREMLERGMTAEQIKMVLEASSTAKSKHKHGCA
jgi:hypothetical protein